MERMTRGKGKRNEKKWNGGVGGKVCIYKNHHVKKNKKKLKMREQVDIVDWTVLRAVSNSSTQSFDFGYIRSGFSSWIFFLFLFLLLLTLLLPSSFSAFFDYRTRSCTCGGSIDLFLSRMTFSMEKARKCRGRAAYCRRGKFFLFRMNF